MYHLWVAEGYASRGVKHMHMQSAHATSQLSVASPLSLLLLLLLQVMSDICKVGAAIEAALGSAQDIEGVVDPDGNVYVVQTRPQV
jgi:alpha-glucan,water dikinase